MPELSRCVCFQCPNLEAKGQRSKAPGPGLLPGRVSHSRRLGPLPHPALAGTPSVLQGETFPCPFDVTESPRGQLLAATPA